ncbi:Paternally-expressed 3 protein-like 1, partial [Homarus americanus]
MGGSLPQIHSILASPGATIIFAPPMAPTFPVGTQGAPQPTSIILPTPTQGVPQPTPLIFPLKNKKVTTSANLHSRFPPLLAPKNVMLKPESENQTLPTKSAKGKKLHLKKSQVKDGKLQQKAQQARSFSVHVKKSAFLEHPVKSILPKFPVGDSQTLLFVPAPLPIQKPSVVSPLTVSSKTAVLNQGGISIFQEGQKGSGKVVRLSLSQSQRYAPPGGHNPQVKNCCSKSFPVTDDVKIPLIHPKRIMGKSKHKNVIAKENNKKLPHPGLRQKSEASCGIKVTSEAKSGSLGPPKNRLKKNENKISTLFPENVFKNFHTELEVERIQGTKNKLCDKSKAEPNKKISILTPQDQTSVPSKHMSQHVALQFSPEQGVPHHPPPPYPQHSNRKETDISSCNTELPIGQEVEETVKEIQCLKTVSQKLVQISKKGCERRCRRQLSFVECPTSISVGITSSENNVTNTSCSSNYANELQISVPSLSSPLIRSATSSVHHSHPEYNSSTLMVSKLEETQKSSQTHLVIVTSSGSSPIPPTYSTSSSMAKNASTVLKSLSNSKDPPLYVAPPALPAMNSPTLEESIFSPTSSIKSQSYSSSVYSPVSSGHPLAGASSNRLSNSSSSSTDFMHSPLSVCQSQFSSSYSPVLTNGHTTQAESSVLTPPLLDTSLITSSSHSSYQMSNSHQPKSTHYTVSTETPLFTQSSQSTSSCQPPQPTPRISPSYSTFYNRSQPAQCDQSPLSLLHTHASCPSSYIHSSQLDSYSYSHQPSSYAQSPQPTTYIKSPQPTSYTQSPQPSSYTQSPQPTSYTQSPQP